jgi:hypothetical protein
VDVIQAAMAARDKKVAAGGGGGVSAETKWTKFQEFFFKLKYGELKEGNHIITLPPPHIKHACHLNNLS